MRAWVVAIAATIAALGLRVLFHPWMDDRFPFMTIFAAIALSAWYGGYRPGILSAVVCGVVAQWSLARGTSQWGADQGAALIGYVLCSSIIIWVGDGHRRARRRLAYDQFVSQRVLESVDGYFAMLDNDWRYIYVNDRMSQVANTPRERLLGKNMWDQFPALRGTEFESTARSAFADQRPARVSFHYPPRDQWLEVQFYPAADSVTMLASDISVQKRAESSLAERVHELGVLYEFTDRLQHAASVSQVYEAAFDAMLRALDAARASILLFDDSGSMRFVAWRNLSDRYRAAVDGHSPWRPGERNAETIWVADIATAEMEEWLRAEVVAEGIAALAFVPLVAGGELIGKFMLYYDAPRKAEQQQLDIAVTIASQLAFAVQRHRTEEQRRQGAAALAQSEEALREANRRKDEFLSTLSHELRNPLAPIVNMLAVIRQAPDDASVRTKGLAMIERQVQHLVRLVDDLLDVGRISHNRLELRRQPVVLRDALMQVVESARPMFEALHHQVSVSVPEHPVLLDADPVRLAQILGNLLNNACKYTPAHGRISLTVSRSPNTVSITVADTGVGIPPNMLQSVFDMFRQLDGSTSRSQGGLGIGLTLVKRLVEMHGGTVFARSAGVGHGSEFVVTLPLTSMVVAENTAA